jgi:hypothetical protein
MPAPTALVTPGSSLSEAAIALLLPFTHVHRDLLEKARIRPAAANWLRAPWYRPHRGGGAITIGCTIFFNRNWFSTRGPGAHGDGSVRSTWHWIMHLAHEAGHLPQAHRHGHHLVGRTAYVTRFASQYLWAGLSGKHMHDDAPLEREADRGRWVLARVVGDTPLTHPLVAALHAGNAAGVKNWCRDNADRIEAAHQAYPY